MIYVALLAVGIAAFGFWRRIRSAGLLATMVDALVAAGLGWVAGLWIGIGARIGMWSIPFFNGTESRFTLDGTLQVVLVFSLYGIALGIIYELVFRDLLRQRGLLYGLVITLVTAYPLGLAGLQQISFQPPFLYAVLFSALFVAVMFVPFGIILELLIERSHRIRGLVPMARGSHPTK